MRRMLMIVVLGVLAESAAQAAAPPVLSRPLTVEEQKQVDTLTKRIGEQSAKGAFEEAERLARQILALRKQVQGKQHWETVNARLEVESWRLLRKVPAEQRGEIARALLLERQAGALRARAKHREAEQADRESLAIRKKVLGEEHPETALSYNNLAVNLSAQGKYAEAQPLLEKALTIRKKALGEEHLDTALSYNNLAVNLSAQGKHAQAQPLFEKALAICKKVLGEEHPSTAECYNNVAMNLKAQAKHAEAQPLYEKALAIYKKAVGEEHRATALSYNNLASNLNAQGKHAKAQPLYEKALAIRKKVLGEEHPDTAQSYNNVAVNLSAQGKHAQAQPLYEKALAICKKVLGEDHPHTAQNYNNVAMNLNAQGKHAEAQPLLEKALAICKKTLDEEHPSTARSYNNVAMNLSAQGKHAEAQPLYEKALAIRKKVLGEEYPDIAQSYNNVAANLNDQGKHAQAQPLFEKALAIRKKVLGEEHPDTALSYNNVAFNLSAQGKHAEAQPLYEKALAIYKKALGEEHRATALSCSNVAFNLDAQGKHAEAQPLFEKALAIRKKILGDEHPDTADSYTNVAILLWNQGDKEKAVLHWQAARRAYAVARIDRAHAGFDRSFAEGRTLAPDVALAAALAGQAKPEQAFRHAEANLARGLLDSLGTGTTITDQERATAEAQVERLDVFLVPLLGRAKLTETEQRKREALLKERTDLFAKLSRQAAEASERLLLPLTQIQKQIPNDAAVVLWIDAFAIGEHWACVLREKGSPIWQRLDGSGPGHALTRDEWVLPSRLLALVSQPTSNPAERQRLIAAVRKQRLDPLRPHLKGVRRLFVVQVCPMEALPVEVLTDEYRVSYIPSPSQFASAMEQHRPLSGTTLLALGDPVFTTAQPGGPPAQGVVLTRVLPKGEADRLGLQAGDVLLRLADTPLRGIDDLRKAVAAVPADLLYWRDGKRHTVRLASARLGVQVDVRPAAQAWRSWSEMNASLILRGTGHAPLPGTRQEVQALARLVPATTQLLGSAASEQNLDQLASSGKLKSFRMLHFATHGEANALDPKKSALILAQDRLPVRPAETVLRGGKLRDGRLTVRTILETWNLDADLVVLSACRSGQGKQSGGAGILGFAQAFLQKKARSVVVSRWKVDDTATTLLMVRFYENLLGKRKAKAMGRADALHEARQWLRQLDRKQAGLLAGALLRGALRGSEEEVPGFAEKEPPLPAGEKPYGHPFFWAAFILVGDPE